LNADGRPKISIQAALVIRGFAIPGFDCSRIHFCNQKFVICEFSLDHLWIFIKIVLNSQLFSKKSGPFAIRKTFPERNLRE
jgi:hypothetical protein